FYISGQGYSWGGSIILVDRIAVIAPDKQICYKDKIKIQATLGHPPQAYRWTYKVLGSEEAEKPLLGNFPTQNVSLEDLYPDNPEQYINSPIQFTVYNDLIGYSSTTTYYWLDCSPNLVGNPTSKNVSCFGSNDGGVTLTFDKNVDKDNGYQMRYFVFDQNANLNFDPAKENPPQTVEQGVLEKLTALNDGTGYYKGTLSTGLSK